jgi:hypothetical protein
VGWIEAFEALALDSTSRLSIFQLADAQYSLNNMFQSIALIYASILCALLCVSSINENRRSFTFLSVGFLILAAGEIDVHSHSIYIDGFINRFGTDNPVALLSPLLAIPIGSAVCLIGFLRRLPFEISAQMVLCGSVYVGGVLIVEMGSQVLLARHGPYSFSYIIIANIEETLETLGIVGFALVLTGYLRGLTPRVHHVRHILYR